MRKLIVATAFVMAAMAISSSVFAIPHFFNGFEEDTEGWFDDGISISRVPSGTNGVASASGGYHAEVDEGAFTRWGGYENAFPTGGYETTIDIYLDMAANTAVGTDLRFDYSSAISTPDGNHRRDFIFSVGTNPAAAGEFAMTASNNSPGWPANPARDPLYVSETGWYTFRHTFQDNGAGVLEVVMDVLDSNGVVLKSWTLSDPSDIIGVTVGGNRYGWFVESDFDFLAVDNSQKVQLATPESKDDCKNGGWQDFTRADGSPFKNQGDCIQYVNTGK